MLLGTLIALSLVTSADVRVVQDEFGDPPPPPPPMVDDGGEVDELPPPMLSEPAPPPDGADRPKKKRRASDDDFDDELEDGEPGFIEKYFPLALNEELHPAVDEALWSFWVANCIPCIPFAPVWFPMLMVEGGAPDGYLVDAIITFIVHIIPHLLVTAVNVAAFLLLPLAAIPVVNLFVAGCMIANFGCLCLNGAASQVNLWYLLPVSLANIMDNALKADGSDESAWLHRRPDDALAAAPMAY